MRGTGSFYVRLAFPLGHLSATMQKSVDNTAPNTLVPEPRRGQVFEDEASEDALSYGIGLVAGYRLPFSSGAYFLDAAVDVATHGGGVEAQFPGVGISPERKQLGESWPDRWNLDMETSYGVTLRLGGSPGGLRSRGISLHVLAGVRSAGARFTNHFDGCFTTEPCDPSQFESGHEDRDMDFTVWKSGIGLEKVPEPASRRADRGELLRLRPGRVDHGVRGRRRQRPFEHEGQRSGTGPGPADTPLELSLFDQAAGQILVDHARQ